MCPPRLKFCPHPGHFHLACDEAIRQQHSLTDQTATNHTLILKEKENRVLFIHSSLTVSCMWKSRGQHWWMPLNGCMHLLLFLPSRHTSYRRAELFVIWNPDENLHYGNMGLNSLIWFTVAWEKAVTSLTQIPSLKHDLLTEGLYHDFSSSVEQDNLRLSHLLFVVYFVYDHVVNVAVISNALFCLVIRNIRTVCITCHFIWITLQ